MAISPVSLGLLGDFELRRDAQLQVLPDGARRVLAYLAVRRRPSARTTVASALWLDNPQDRAGAYLRTALWRLRQAGQNIVEQTNGSLELAPHVSIDFVKLIDRAHELIRSGHAECDHRDLEVLSGDLLPGWDEDWLVIERERLRQLRLHALETLSGRLSAYGRHSDAIEAALAAVEADPLRESAQRILIAAHLAEGNRSEAVRVFAEYRRVTLDELGIPPSDDLIALLGHSRMRPAPIIGRDGQ